jgi:hypothetical protein
MRLRVDVIVAAATPASRAAKAATSTIPIVIVAVREPVRAGLVASFARPGGNVTGLSLLTPELSGKAIELLMDALSKLSRMSVLMNPDNPVSAVLWFPKIPSNRIRAVRQNQRIIRNDACDPPFAWNVCRRSVQVAAPA